MQYLEDLNNQQRVAVESIDGPIMVIAGAGSGKTRVLTYRLVHLINYAKVDPANILVLTFTNKAAREMKERSISMVGDYANRMWMGTFHSVFAKILRIEHEYLGYPSSFTIYDTQDSQSLVGRILKDLDLDKEIYKPKDIYGRISQYKNRLVTPEVFLRSREFYDYEKSLKRPLFGEIYSEYCNRCYKQGAMDFDDLLLKTNQLLTKHPDVLDKYQEIFKYILVDEYQDTNHSQYIIIKSLAKKYCNVCVVGDDAQSIYQFRGSNIKNILNFKKDYPEANIFRLEQNYRSTVNIVKAANAVIANNPSQIKKEVWTDNEQGQKIKFFHAHSDIDEVSYVVKKIEEKRQSYQSYDNFAVLYRKNAYSRLMEEALRRKGIPYKVYGFSFYQRKEIKDLMAYLRLIINTNDDEALIRIINYPARKIGQTTLIRLSQLANSKGLSLMNTIASLNETPSSETGIQNVAISRLEIFHNMIASLKGKIDTHNAFEIVDGVLKESGIWHYLNQDKTVEKETSLEYMQEFLNSSQLYVQEQEETGGGMSVVDFFESMILSSGSEDEESGEKVSLMTVHSSKGLEFDCLFVIGMEENSFPSFMSSQNHDDLEEERRLFYVALTRAKKELFITCAKSRYQWGRPVESAPSRFLKELPKELIEVEQGVRVNNYIGSNVKSQGQDSLEMLARKIKSVSASSNEVYSNIPPKGYDFKIGDRIKHQRFGLGEILAFSGEKANAAIKVRFDNVGEKKLLLYYAKLEKL